jgi:NAD(P)-dependent dehydrogenase (short-subunit alcohol dehydrogenase family)
MAGFNRYTDQVAIITGGADGLGKSMTHRLATEGAKVVIFDYNDEKRDATVAEFADQGLDVSGVALDISSAASVSEAVGNVLSATDNRLDVMINCAGVVGPTNTKVVDYDIEAFDNVVAVNLRGSFLMAKYCLPPMIERGYGRILLVASIAGKDGNPGMAGYTASKAGVIGMVKAFGKEYAETGITVNGLAPAVIQTAMVDGIDPAMLKYMTDRIPMKRTGSLEEAAATAAYIVSSEASFNTGFVFDLSGGRAVY